MNHTIERMQRLAQPRLPTRGKVKRGNFDHSLAQLVIRFCKNWLIVTVVHNTPRYVLTTGEIQRWIALVSQARLSRGRRERERESWRVKHQ